MNETGEKGHTLCLTDRARAEICGVEDVECFSEEVAVIRTSLGDMTVSGAGLKVARLDIQSGVVEIEGSIDGIEYGAIRRGGLISRIFK